MVIGIVILIIGFFLIILRDGLITNFIGLVIVVDGFITILIGYLSRRKKSETAKESQNNHLLMLMSDGTRYNG